MALTPLVCLNREKNAMKCCANSRAPRREPERSTQRERAGQRLRSKLVGTRTNSLLKLRPEAYEVKVRKERKEAAGEEINRQKGDSPRPSALRTDPAFSGKLMANADTAIHVSTVIYLRTPAVQRQES